MTDQAPPDPPDRSGRPDAPGPRPRRRTWRRGASPGDGDDPDYRFSLANERTFLAWIRTALALLAGAVAVVQLIPRFNVQGARTIIGAVLSLAGLLVAGLSYARWSGNERAMRLGRPLPYTPVLVVVASAVFVVGVLVLLLVLFAAR